jgi:hypothetical protein
MIWTRLRPPADPRMLALSRSPSRAGNLHKRGSFREVLCSPAPPGLLPIVILFEARSMRLSRFLEILFRDTVAKMGALPSRSPPRTDRLVPPRTRQSVEWLVEHPSDAALQRKEKCVAAVGLSVAISAALSGTVWAEDLTEDARAQTLVTSAKIVARSTRTALPRCDCAPEGVRPTAPAGRDA